MVGGGGGVMVGEGMCGTAFGLLGVTLCGTDGCGMSGGGRLGKRE